MENPFLTLSEDINFMEQLRNGGGKFYEYVEKISKLKGPGLFASGIEN